MQRVVGRVALGGVQSEPAPTLDVPGEELPKVMYQVREAEQYQGERILVVGGGDSAVEAAVGLSRQPGNKVFLSYRKENFARIKQKNLTKLEAQIKKGRIRTILNSSVSRIEEESVIVVQGGKPYRIANDFVFVMIGGDPPFPFLRKIGVRFGDDLLEASRQPTLPALAAASLPVSHARSI